MLDLFLYLGLAAVSTAVVWKASVRLEMAADRLAAHYRLPGIVQGAVLAAVGSSFPELSSTVIATLLHGEFDLGVAAIVGSAVFNILVIPGLSGLAGQGLASDRLLVYKDAQFYLIAVAVLVLTFSFALIYHPVAGTEWVGTVDRPLALLPLLLYGLYLFLQQQDTADHRAEQSSAAREPIRVGREWGALALTLAAIVAGVEGLVRAAIGLGEALDTPNTLWGLTVIAAGTSLPDAFVSYQAARREEGVVSLANVLGSNIFDLLVAIPAGVLIAGAATIDYAVAAPLMGFLTLATIVLFAMLRTGLTLTVTESRLLLLLYAVFIGWMVLETMGVTDLVF